MQDHLLQRRMLRHSPWMLWSFQPQSLLQPVLLPLMTSQPKGENIKYQLKPVGSKTEIMGEHGSPASASTRAPTTTGTPSTESSSPAPTIPTPVGETPVAKKKARARKPKVAMQDDKSMDPVLMPVESGVEVPEAEQKALHCRVNCVVGQGSI